MEGGGGLSTISVFLIVYCRMGMTWVGTWFLHGGAEYAAETLPFSSVKQYRP